MERHEVLLQCGSPADIVQQPYSHNYFKDTHNTFYYRRHIAELISKYII
jgi:hypothetical protein